MNLRLQRIAWWATPESNRENLPFEERMSASCISGPMMRDGRFELATDPILSRMPLPLGYSR